MATKTLEQAREEHRDAVDANRMLGVVEYETGLNKLSDQVWEVDEGYVHLPNGKTRKRIGPGHRFRPTEKQVSDGSLKNKARQLTQSEYAGLDRASRKPVSAGADIGLRALSIEKDALAIALDANLDEADFADVKPGRFGRYTAEQVEQIIASKQS